MSDLEHRPASQNGKLTSQRSATFSGIRADILLGGEAAPMTVMEMTVEAEQGAPDHISHDEDKVFKINKGNFLFSVGVEKIEAAAGDCVFVGKGVAHSFVALGDEHSVMTLVSTPARHDRFFRAMDALALPHEMSKVQDVCKNFKQSIIGPVVQPSA